MGRRVRLIVFADRERSVIHDIVELVGRPKFL